MKDGIIYIFIGLAFVVWGAVGIVYFGGTDSWAVGVPLGIAFCAVGIGIWVHVLYKIAQTMK